MKTVYLVFFLLSWLLSGCGTSYNYPSKKITVEKKITIDKRNAERKNTVKKDYALLSVRGDSAIVVLDWAEAKVTPIPFSHAEVIKRDSIEMISRSGHSGIGNVLAGGMIGVLSGSIITGLLLPKRPSGDFIFMPEKDFDVMTIGIVSGAVIGATLFYFLPPSKILLLDSAEDREFLRRVSLYPEKEPEEMQYVN